MIDRNHGEEMIDRDAAEEIIAKYLDEVRLKRIIRNTSIVAWKQAISDKQISKWLDNFDGKYFKSVENERKLALWLLAHFTYYTYDDVRVLCKDMFNRYLHTKLIGCDSEELDRKITEIIQNTIFIGLGNDSESGNNILYYFRQENQLPKTSFEIVPGRCYENLVYIDDVTISGEQALTYIRSRNINAEKIYAALLIATEEAEKRIAASDIGVATMSMMTLDDRDRVFSDSAYVFSEKKIARIRPIAEEFCRLYGNIAVQGCGYMVKHPLGFDNGQYMIGFEYNTPDNTLPIFWGTGGGWKPLFKRYQKLYNGREYVLDGRKYY